MFQRRHTMRARRGSAGNRRRGKGSRVGGGRWGREDLEWNRLVEATTEFLAEQGRLQRTTTYTELNSVLGRRTDAPTFDFDRESERAAMGALLGEVAQNNLQDVGAMLSAIVIYLNENDAGAGFYRYAVELGLLTPRPTADQRLTFWATQVKTVHDHYKQRA